MGSNISLLSNLNTTLDVKFLEVQFPGTSWKRYFILSLPEPEMKVSVPQFIPTEENGLHLSTGLGWVLWEWCPKGSMYCPTCGLS
jgi:hypothetical protein